MRAASCRISSGLSRRPNVLRPTRIQYWVLARSKTVGTAFRGSIPVGRGGGLPLRFLYYHGSKFLSRTAATSDIRDEATELAKRVFEFSEFLVKQAHVSDVGAFFPHKVAYHDACHALRELHLKQEPRELLANVQGLELVEMLYSEDCCGFGGTFAAKFNMISAAMGDAKAGNAEASGAEFLTSTDPSCLMQIEGILCRRKSTVRTLHLASILAQTDKSSRNTSAMENRSAIR